MTDAPKPTLTEAERESLDLLRWYFDAHAENPKSGYASAGIATARGKVARMIAAREAAARREALLEVQFRLQPPPPWPATGSEAPDRGYAAGWGDALSVVEELLAEGDA